MPMGDGPNDVGLSRHHIIRGVRGQPAPARHRLHRPLPGARVGRRRRRSRRRSRALDDLVQLRQGPLHRLLQLHRLAADEGARASPSARPASASSASRSTTRCRPATPRTSSCPLRSTRASGILVWSPLAGGLLSGKYRRGQSRRPAGSRHLTEWAEPPVHDEDKLYDTIDVLVEIGEAHGVSAAQVALAYLLGQARRDLGDRRRPHRGAAGRQPRRRRARADAGRGRPARRA